MKTLLTTVAMIVSGGAFAQSVIPGLEPGGTGHLLPSDSAILDLHVPRRDFPCTINFFKPELGMDFMFHTGYRVRIPIRELGGEANVLTIVFRVYADEHEDKASHFVQKFKVPSMRENATGEAALDGTFRLGEGKYHLDWLVRDIDERVCASFWDLEAKIDANQAVLAEAVPKNIVEPSGNVFAQPFTADEKESGGPLYLRIIVNVAPQDIGRATLAPADLQTLAAILHRIAREPQVGRYSLVACSLPGRQVLYRQENEPQLRLPRLGDALRTLSLGKVDVKDLAMRNGETQFLADLIRNELKKDRPDAVIFVGPKCPLDSNVSSEIIADLKAIGIPVFYLTYTNNPLQYPWRDAIGHVVKELRGFQYTITYPRDLFNAWSDVLSRILKAKACTDVRAER